MATIWRQVAVIACVLLLAAAAPSRGAPAATATPIQHVIIIVQENHSFDNYFGTYPTANGTLVTPITSALPAVNGIPNGVCIPYEGECASPEFTTSIAPTNPIEGQLVYEADYADNATGFVDNSGIQSMVYFDYHTIPAYWDYAEEYGLGDNYFAPVLTQTNANRLLLLTGNSSVEADNGPPPYVEYNGSLLSQLDGAGVSWGYFDWINVKGQSLAVHPLNYLTGVPAQALNDIHDIPTLFKDLSSGSGLPNVSFVSSLGNTTLDEHPTHDPTTGEKWVVSIINSVESSAYWNSTAIFLTWDEGGGFYDHVVPPKEFVINNTGFTSPLLGLGERIPLLVVSPFSKESYVSNTLLSHLSLDHFIEYNWKLSPLNQYYANASLPLGFFNFSQPLRPPLLLGTSGPDSMSTYPIPLQATLSQTNSTQTSASSSTSNSSTSSSSTAGSSSSTSTSSASTSVSASSTISTNGSSSFSWSYVWLVAVNASIILGSGGLVALRRKRSGAS
jgi:phospholipase C